MAAMRAADAHTLPRVMRSGNARVAATASTMMTAIATYGIMRIGQRIGPRSLGARMNASIAAPKTHTGIRHRTASRGIGRKSGISGTSHAMYTSGPSVTSPRNEWIVAVVKGDPAEKRSATSALRKWLLPMGSVLRSVTGDVMIAGRYTDRKSVV